MSRRRKGWIVKDPATGRFISGPRKRARLPQLAGIGLGALAGFLAGAGLAYATRIISTLEAAWLMLPSFTS
jgi:hypothetical protein